MKELENGFYLEDGKVYDELGQLAYNTIDEYYMDMNFADPELLQSGCTN